jgi:tetratricopeptide (TPR) repeat protein
MDHPTENLSPFVAGLAEVERLLHEGTSASAEEARVLAVNLAADLRQTPDVGGPGGNVLLVALLTAQGHAERNVGLFAEAVQTYEEALSLLPETSDNSRERNRRANLLTCRGLSLLTLRDDRSLAGALDSFDQSIAERSDSPDTTEAERWGLSAAWLNRADALAGLGGRERLHDAIESTGRAREILEALGPDKHPPYRSRLALAWMKAGECASRLCTECGETMQEQAIAHHAEAVAVLRPGAEAGIEESRRMLAVALCNLSRARLILAKSGCTAGETEAREALTWLGDAELSSPETLTLGLTARITAACHLESSRQDDECFLDLTDLAEEALAIAAEGRRRHGRHVVNAGLLGELTRLGAHAYLIVSPAFLADFLLDLLDPERTENHFADVAEVHEAAVRVLWRGIAEVQKAGFAGIGSEDYEARRERLVDWEECRERLAAIRDRYFTR